MGGGTGSGGDKAASPVLKVIDALACGRHGPGVRMCLADRLADIGIDPDMSVDELRELLAPEPDFDALTIPPPRVVRRGRIVWDDPSTPDITEGLT